MQKIVSQLQHNDIVKTKIISFFIQAWEWHCKGAYGGKFFAFVIICKTTITTTIDSRDYNLQIRQRLKFTTKIQNCGDHNFNSNNSQLGLLFTNSISISYSIRCNYPGSRRDAIRSPELDQLEGSLGRWKEFPVFLLPCTFPHSPATHCHAHSSTHKRAIRDTKFAVLKIDRKLLTSPGPRSITSDGAVTFMRRTFSRELMAGQEVSAYIDFGIQSEVRRYIQLRGSVCSGRTE